MSRSKRNMPSREGTGNCVTTSAATRLAASGWLFIEDSLEEGTLPFGCGGFGKVASCPEGWQAAMLDAVDRLSAGGAENLDRLGVFAAWEIERRPRGASRATLAPTFVSGQYSLWQAHATAVLVRRYIAPCIKAIARKSHRKIGPK
ncbi:hypothetical protein [Pseudomonas sp. GD03696]|uniref:hypothetical protein n=1 Tax=Pseudomonas TaxID=286 RepID=UPI002447AE31|nr:hypothetical protein [Pseudomonas sp. GD03696]MDH1929968.1 hypothetical protein [Pseudomonas sp. GD03696]